MVLQSPRPQIGAALAFDRAVLLDSAAGQLLQVTLVDLLRSSPSDSERVANRLEGHAPYSHVDESTGSLGPF
jgi:hypothetical protein